MLYTLVGICQFAGPRYTGCMKVNAVGKKFSEAERAYFAGFLDADGAIMAIIERHQEKKFGWRVRINIKITQRDRKTLDWFLSRFRIGYIRKNRTTFDWEIKDQNVCLSLVEMLIPYLKAKKRQACIAKSILQTSICSRRDILKVARMADILSRFNVRSKGRRRNFSTMIEEDFSSNDLVKLH
jgi:hypothetical protein